jgi:MFS transporter, CP family, cyanate transporter
VTGFLAALPWLMQGETWKLYSRMPLAGTPAAESSGGSAIKLVCLLWLAGVAMRMTLLVMPPVIPQVHDELHLSETQVGLLIGLPLAVFAIAAIPGSLLISRIGATVAVTLGMAIAAIAGGARAAAIDIWTLYAAAIVSAFGVAIMQPGMPTLVREWLPSRIAVGTIGYSAGMLMGAMLPAVFTIAFVLPAVGGDWRLNVLFWAVPALLMAPVFLLLSPRTRDSRDKLVAGGGSWWPDWKDPLVWLLGFTFASNNSTYFVTSAFIGDYLGSLGKPELLGPALGWLNGSQIFAVAVLLVTANRLQLRAWPFLVFGPIMLAAFVVLLVFTSSALAIVTATAVVGVAAAVTMTAILALPALLTAPADVPRTAAGMFTVSYTCAVIIPTICGGLWDLTGKPWTVFVPVLLCCVALTVLGAIVVRFRPAPEKTPGR